MTTIAFIGLGNMGGPMAANLQRAGHTVVGYDVQAEACAAAKARHIVIASSVAAAARDADVIVTMLPSGALVNAVWREATRAARPGTMMIDSSTIDVASAREAHALAQAAGHASLDAPVSGGTEGASNATLTFMVGGAADTFARANPILAAMGRKIVHCGIAGNG